VSASIATAVALLAMTTSAPAQTSEQLRISGLTVDGGEDGWHADNYFHIEWNLPPPDGRLRIDTTNYRIRDEAGNIVMPQVQIRQPLAEIQQLIVPGAAPRGKAAPGKYTLEVWLEGNAGEGPPATASLRLDDTQPAPARPIAPASWIRAGTETVLRIEHPALPYPVSGIRGYAVLLDHGSGGAPCAGPDRCSEAEIDLPSGVADDSISLGVLAEGVNIARVAAVSGSGLRSETESVPLRVDATEPEVVLDGVPSGWSSRPVRLSATAHDAQSGMDPSGPAGPFTAIALDGAAAAIAAGDSVTTTVRGDGAHRVSFYGRDAVGNVGDDEAAAGPPRTATVRIDETPPGVAFGRSQDLAEPERIEAVVSDSLSGPGSTQGSIAVRAAGSSARFEPLPTTVSAGGLSAVWDSDAYPPGSYEFRATGYDAAGNYQSSDRRLNGTRMVLANPLKRPTAVAFGFGGKQLVWHRCARSHGALRCHRRVIGPFERRPAKKSIPYGRGVPVAGRLASATGSPLAGMPVTLIETFAAGAGAARRATTVETRPDGTFLAHLAPGPSRSLQVVFAGDRVLSRSASRMLDLGVRASVRLSASTARAEIGGAPVVFRGQIPHAEATIPAEGRPVQLQFRLPHTPWTEFRSVQTDARGRFHYLYAFSDDDSRGIRFEFRAFAPSQPGWPYEAAASRPVAVTGH
jgi:plastocyanin